MGDICSVKIRKKDLPTAEKDFRKRKMRKENVKSGETIAVTAG